MAVWCTTLPAAMHHLCGRSAPFRRWRCTIIRGQVALLGRHMHDPSQTGIFTPIHILHVVHRNQILAIVLMGPVIALHTGIHPIPQSFAGQQGSVLLDIQVALEAGTSLLAGKTVCLPVAVVGFLSRLGNEIEPAVITTGNALSILMKVQGELQSQKSKDGMGGIDLDRKSTRLNSSHSEESRMPSSA